MLLFQSCIWLSLQDYLSALVVLCSGLMAVTAAFQGEATAGFVGLAITYALLVSC